jgi:DNA replication protein DnaC
MEYAASSNSMLSHRSARDIQAPALPNQPALSRTGRGTRIPQSGLVQSKLCCAQHNFDFKFQPSIDPKQIRELATGRYIQSGDNLLLLGPPGVGKSHLAIALGIKACEQGIRTLFVTATALITTLGKALAEGKLDERLKLLTQPQLLICDELGYLPIDRQGANLFFQLVSRRYERGSIIITSNQSLGAWGEVFGDTVIASAILDRLLHHSITINIKGESFRLKEKLRAGLLRPKLEAPTAS